VQQAKDVAQPAIPVQLPVNVAVPKDVDSSEYYSKIREITISTIFFEVDTKKLSEAGINFSFLRGNNLNLGVSLQGGQQMVNQYIIQNPNDPNTGQKANFYSVSANPTGLTVDVNTMLAVFQSNQLGEIISRPQVIVRSGSSSMIQIGQDISVNEKDFSGNTVTKFYPTGTILNVHPKLYRINNLDFIDLRYTVEKSSATTATTTTIDKTKVDGSLTLLNGEEGYVGGMYDNETTTVRNGVPLLKDLPWWVFGLRYIFGYNSESLTKKELIVLMKAELVPLIEERAAQHVTQKDVIQDRRNDIQKDIDKHSIKK
jgi:type IV pilus assembly protein PilQ